MSHVEEVRSRGLKVGLLDEVLSGGDGVVALTFDDAYESVYSNAFPLLCSLGVTATVFVPVNYVGGMNTYDYYMDFGPRNPARIMTWSQIRELAAAGWSIQSHGCSHLPLSCLEAAHVEDELERSKATLEDRVGAEVRYFAYPFGMADDSEADADREGVLERSGYRLAVLADGGWTETPPPRPYLVPRYPAGGEQSHLPLLRA